MRHEFLQAMEASQDFGCCWKREKVMSSRSYLGNQLLIYFFLNRLEYTSVSFKGLTLRPPCGGSFSLMSPML